MATMRAKMFVSMVIKDVSRENSAETLHMVPVSGAYDKNGDSEDNTFAKWSPSGRFEMTITNPALHGKFKAGDTYYVDFTPASK